MSSAGGDLFQGNSRLFANPLGVVQMGFNGFDLGKTTADSNLRPDQDIKDIMYQQEGTKAADHVRTGQDVILSCTFGEIKTGLLVQLMSGVTTNNTDPLKDSGDFGRNIYQSMRDNEAKGLRVVAVDENGLPSEEDEDILSFYEAIPIITGDLINWGADTQRNLAMEFRIKYHVFAPGESVTKKGSFGYWGDPVTEDMPPIVYPDLTAPFISTAVVDSATQVTLTFNEIIALVGGVTLNNRISALVDGDVVVPTTSVIGTSPDDDKITVTFPAATFAAGNVVKLSISAGSVENTAAVPIQNEEVCNTLVTNPLV